jgi:hypothetical protein
MKLPLCSALNIKAYRGRGVKLWHITHAEEDEKFEFLAAEEYLAVVWKADLSWRRCISNFSS